MHLRRLLFYLSSASLAFAAAAVTQQQPAAPAYDIVSVRPSDPKLAEGQISPLPNGTGYSAVRVTVKDMLAVMYRVPRRQIVGGPEWMGSENFDVEARAERSYSVDELHAMFQKLLAERFHLKLHVASEEGRAYVLTVAPAGVKMKPVDAGADRHNPITAVGANRYRGDRVPMNYLCFWLGQNLQNDQRPVVDRTGLAGTYSFELTFRPQAQLSAAGDEASDLPSIFQALKKQLGLVLTPGKAPVQMLVIDHVERPSGN